MKDLITPFDLMLIISLTKNPGHDVISHLSRNDPRCVA